MKVQVRLFARYREAAGRDSLDLELPDGGTVERAWEAVARQLPALEPYRPFTLFALRNDYVDADRPLADGDELCLFPPVSGGAGPAVRVTGEALDVAALSAAVRDPRAGAVVVFEGVTREVPELEYEAYAEMAAERIARIATEEAGRHGLCAVAVEHRTGTVPLGEPSVIVAASAPHRGEAFAGARALIDRVKAEAPIWKVELTAEGARRVDGVLPWTG